MSALTYIECDFCGHKAFMGSALLATAELAREELRLCGWQCDEKDKCKWCVRGVPAPARFGGSPKMGTSTASSYTSDITPLDDMQTDESEDSSLGLEKKLFSAPNEPTPCLSGETSSTTADSKGSTAPSSVTKDAAYHRASYAKRIKSLIASGLVAGITPTSTRKQSPQQTLDFALSPRAGDAAAEPREDS